MSTPCLAKNWWVVGLRGGAGILFGALALLVPATTLAAMTVFFALYAIADGAMSLCAATRAPAGYVRSWGMLLEGVAGLALGFFTMFFPDITLLTAVFCVAAWAAVTGVFEIIGAFRLRKHLRGEWLLAASGLLSVIFGAVLLVLPQVGLVALMLGIGTYAIASGAMLVALSWRLRRCELERIAERRFGSTPPVPRQRPEPVPRPASL